MYTQYSMSLCWRPSAETLCLANDFPHLNPLLSTENPNTKWRMSLTAAYSANGYNTLSNSMGGMTSLGNRQLKSTSSKPLMTSMPTIPTNPAPSQKIPTKLQWTSALEGGYCHGMDQMTTLLVPMHAYALILMHTYPSAYTYQFDYVCLCYHLIIPI
jgi:hypothetical protein